MWPRKEYLSRLEQHLVYQVEATGNRLKALCSEILPSPVRSRKQMSWVKPVTFYLFFSVLCQREQSVGCSDFS